MFWCVCWWVVGCVCVVESWCNGNWDGVWYVYMWYDWWVCCDIEVDLYCWCDVVYGGW